VFDGEVVHHNSFLGLRLMDEEIAIATLLTATSAWVRDEGPAPSALAEACQDQPFSLAIDRAADSGPPVVTTGGTVGGMTAGAFD
jgi:hypothetical protein